MWIEIRRDRGVAPLTRRRLHGRVLTGAALTVVCVLVLAIAAVVLPVVRRAPDEPEAGKQQALPRSPRSAADAALADAWSIVEQDGFASLRQRAPEAPRTTDGPRCIVVCVDGAEHEHLENDLKRVVAVAWRDGEHPVVASELIIREVQFEAPPSLGAFGNRSVSLGAGASIDSYDSRKGDWASQHTGRRGEVDVASRRGDVRSNGTISLSAGAVIMGDARPGPMRTVTLGGDAHVEGTTAASESGAHPAPVHPPTRAGGDDRLIREDQRETTQAGSHSWRALTLERGASLTIIGPADLVVGELRLADAAVLRADATNGPVRIQVSGNATIGRECAVGVPGGRPADLTLRVAGADTTVSLGTDASLTGRLYAPHSDVALGPRARVFGSVVADRLRLAEGAAIHVDEHVLDTPDAPGAPMYDLIGRRDLAPAEARLLASAAFDGVRD